MAIRTIWRMSPAAISLSPARAARPSLALFVTDDQGQDSCGCYGNPVGGASQ